MTTEGLLATDMDGTVVPLDDGSGRAAEIAALAGACAGRPELSLAFLTGRHLELAVEGITSWALPLPAALACDVGTSLYWRDGDGWRRDETYSAVMATRAGGMSLAEATRTLDSVPGLQLQEAERQAKFKRSYYAPLEQITDDAVALLRQRLRDEGAELQLVASVDPVRGCGLLDVLPAGVDKATALRFLQTELAIPDDRCLYAGDSGNDTAALLSGCLGVVVGNAAVELKQFLRREISIRADRGRIYFAEAAYAAGVLEGARHFGWLAGTDEQ